MPKANLRPFATLEAGLDQYLGYNFARLENLFERMRDVLSGTVVVTGTATVATGLAIVDGVVVSLRTVPSANAAFVTAVPGAAAGTVDIAVYTSAFVPSGVGVSVQWIAVGELVLN